MTILFVCTGNTCRSPMAACLWNELCQGAERAGFRALSAGVNAPSGMGASDGARRAMERRGLTLTAHRSRPVTGELLDRVDLVVGMSERHIQSLKTRFPAAKVPMRAFDPPIPDPYGGGDETYEATARELEPQLAALLHLLEAERGEDASLRSE